MPPATSTSGLLKGIQLVCPQVLTNVITYKYDSPTDHKPIMPAHVHNLYNLSHFSIQRWPNTNRDMSKDVRNDWHFINKSPQTQATPQTVKAVPQPRNTGRNLMHIQAPKAYQGGRGHHIYVALRHPALDERTAPSLCPNSAVPGYLRTGSDSLLGRWRNLECQSFPAPTSPLLSSHATKKTSPVFFLEEVKPRKPRGAPTCGGADLPEGRNLERLGDTPASAVLKLPSSAIRQNARITALYSRPPFLHRWPFCGLGIASHCKLWQAQSPHGPGQRCLNVLDSTSAIAKNRDPVLRWILRHCRNHRRRWGCFPRPSLLRTAFW